MSRLERPSDVTISENHSAIDEYRPMSTASPAPGAVDHTTMMDRKFQDLLSTLTPSLDRLRKTPPMEFRSPLPDLPRKGAYLFSEGSRHLYIGRSNNLRQRYRLHCHRGATDRQAAFAFRLAREATGRMTPSYRQGDDSRQGLMQDEKFQAAFADAKKRIIKMKYRYVEEPDQIRQALLEIYCAVALQTPYNDFGTH